MVYVNDYKQPMHFAIEWKYEITQRSNLHNYLYFDAFERLSGRERKEYPVDFIEWTQWTDT